MTTTSTQFAAVPRTVIEMIPKIGGNTLAMYVILADHANSSHECWPSVKRLALLAGTSERTARRTIQALQESGVIAIESRNDEDGVQKSNLYKILPPYQPPGQTVQGSLTEVVKAPCQAAQGHPDTDDTQTRFKEQEPKNKKADAVLIPDSLNTKKFLSAWEDFKQHRIEIKKRLTPTSTRQALKKLEAMGPTQAAAALEHTVANGWQGIFEPSANRNGKPNQPQPTEPIKYRNPHA